MMASRKIPATLIVIILLCLSSCNLKWGTPLIAGATGTPPVNEQTLIAQAARQTLEAASTNTPSFTGTPQFTFTPSVPMVSVSVDTNCRTGPGTAYDILGALLPGQTAEVVGRNSSGDTWIIRLPSNPSITCWLWGYYATVTGNTSAVPVIVPPPTPTPVASFTFAYSYWGVGPGYQCLEFDVTNTGTATWQSFSLTLENQTDGGSWTSTADVFTDYDGWCTPIDPRIDLEPGEIGTAAVTTFMLSSFAGDTLKANLTLCTLDGLSGTCITKTLTFIG